MSRLPHVADDQLDPELREKFAFASSHMGFLPNSLRVLAHNPAIASTFMDFARSVMGTPADPLHGVKALAAHVSSNVSGCRYCQAHTASTALRTGADPEKIAHAFEFETHPVFSAAERAVLRVAAGAGTAPNGVTDADFAAMREHFSDAQCAEILSMIALFGFLNRFNDTLATSLEAEPADIGERHLAARGWQAGKHGS